ncbi:hypothetical protein I6A60_08555 [Frankia sp. AgB1.9]|uniref:hypothetical protein n=1 Tax=unclassified Frankia TaxID=2632575 RepID=UPI0019311E8D|nr:MULTISPECIES: hypothetical protein [unclassified Frankia]MBL7487177.1 hypothetical protein [Frankia sp. AgW1.1]MBL7547922.1 hypothetical protein [Frankia sp. AgB1.9]
MKLYCVGFGGPVGVHVVEPGGDCRAAAYIAMYTSRGTVQDFSDVDLPTLLDFPELLDDAGRLGRGVRRVPPVFLKG